MSSHRVNFRRHPSAQWPPTWRACSACGATCKTVREQQEHADVMEGRAQQEDDQ